MRSRLIPCAAFRRRRSAAPPGISCGVLAVVITVVFTVVITVVIAGVVEEGVRGAGVDMVLKAFARLLHNFQKLRDRIGYAVVVTTVDTKYMGLGSPGCAPAVDCGRTGRDEEAGRSGFKDV